MGWEENDQGRNGCHTPSFLISRFPILRFISPMGIVVSFLFFIFCFSVLRLRDITSRHCIFFLHGSISHACIASHTWAFVWEGLCRRVGFPFFVFFFGETRLRRLFWVWAWLVCVFVFVLLLLCWLLLVWLRMGVSPGC